MRWSFWPAPHCCITDWCTHWKHWSSGHSPHPSCWFWGISGTSASLASAFWHFCRAPCCDGCRKKRQTCLEKCPKTLLTCKKSMSTCTLKLWGAGTVPCCRPAPCPSWTTLPGSLGLGYQHSGWDEVVFEESWFSTAGRMEEQLPPSPPALVLVLRRYFLHHSVRISVVHLEWSLPLWDHVYVWS